MHLAVELQALGKKGCASRSPRQQFILQMNKGGSRLPRPHLIRWLVCNSGLAWGSWHAAASSRLSLCRHSPAKFLVSGPRICINLDGLMWGARQLDFPCGSESQLGRRGLPLAVQPSARWWVMACGGSRADVPHCARTQKQAGLDFFSPPHPSAFIFLQRCHPYS